MQSLALCALVGCGTAPQKPAEEAPQCFWMEIYSHQYKWTPANALYGKPLSEAECRALDSCNGGGGQSGGGCYTWGTVAPEDRWNGAMPERAPINFE